MADVEELVMSVELHATMKSVRMPPTLIERFRKKEFLESLDIKLLGGTDELAEKAVGETIPKGAEEGAFDWGITERTKVRKLWTLCAGAGPGPSGSAAGQVARDGEQKPPRRSP